MATTKKKKRPGLWANINARKKAGTSRSKKNCTISAKAYSNMQAGFPKTAKKVKSLMEVELDKKKLQFTNEDGQKVNVDIDQDQTEKEEEAI